MSFQDRIKKILEDDYTSQVGLADDLGVSKAIISKYLKSERSPNFEMLEKFYRLGYNLNWLVSGKGSRKKEYLNFEVFDNYDRSLIESIGIAVKGKSYINKVTNRLENKSNELSKYTLEYLYFNNLVNSLQREITLNRSFISISNILYLEGNSEEVIFKNFMPAVDNFLKYEKLYNDNSFLKMVKELNDGDELEFILSLSEVYVLYTEIEELNKRMSEFGIREFGEVKNIYKQIYDLMRNPSYLSVKADKFYNVVAKTFNLDFTNK